MRRGRARRPAPVSEAAFRRPMAIVAIKQFGNGETYPVCPRCRITMEREYQNFCDRCGRRWIGGSMPMRGSCWYLGV